VSIHGEAGVARILDHIALRLERGRIMGLVGESACGKSTFIRTILGVLAKGGRVESGRIAFDGTDLLAMSDRAMNTNIRGRRIGFIPQDPLLALNPLFRVGTQLLEIMRNHAAPGDHRARLLDLLRRVQLPDPEGALRRYPHQFSGGQRQRLLIAAALTCAPALIVADEPTTALDVTTQQQILILLKELVAETGTALLFVTHDLGVVAQTCDEMAVIYAGQMVETGPTRDVLANPRHPYTRALLACHPDRSTGFASIPGTVPPALHMPPGCRFAPRCPIAQSACPARKPHLLTVGPDHAADCILYETAA
jgi:peptide/nickel transport system ATP-binding protein